jgi:hypothetical protein
MSSMAARRTAVAVCGVLVLLTSGCGAAEDRSDPEGAGALPHANAARTTVYFLSSNGSAPVGVKRSIPRRSPIAREALRALLTGPSADERNSGITSALPSSVELRSLRTEANAEAVVDLAGLPTDAGGVDRARIITQITRSLVGLSGIERVRLRDRGEPWGLWRMSGGVMDVSYGYDDLLGLFRVCSAKPGTEAVEGDCFTALP